MKFETPDVEIIYLDADDIVCSSVAGPCEGDLPSMPITPTSGTNSLNGKKEE